MDAQTLASSPMGPDGPAAAVSAVVPSGPPPSVHDIDIPACPSVLVELSLLLAEDEPDQAALSRLVLADMALASSVLRAVNSAAYGLQGRVRTVQQAVAWLGTREIAALMFELSLRAAFQPTAELQPIWQRAAPRGQWMGRMAKTLGSDAWSAHAAGLFQECGKAVLHQSAPDHHRAMLRAARDDAELAALERAGFGIGHDAVGAVLCADWGLAGPSVGHVRHHADETAVDAREAAGAPAGPPDPEPTALGQIQALGQIVDAWLAGLRGDALDASIDRAARRHALDAVLLRHAARQLPAPQGSAEAARRNT